MMVVLYTDASYRQWVQSGTYAFWARSDAGRIQQGGKFRARIEDSTHAELNCIANAVYLIQSKWPHYTSIIINTDSLISQTVILGDAKKVPAKWQPVYQFITNLLKNKKVEFKHVKAHTGDKGIRTYLNDWCDKEARKYWKQ